MTTREIEEDIVAIAQAIVAEEEASVVVEGGIFVGVI
jgi:hypothetical protein